MSSMNRRQRLEAAIAGQPVDRPPVALWRHWPGDDQRAEGLARATLDFQSAFDFDFIKFMPSSNYCLADWGAESWWLGNQEGTRNWGPRVIQRPEDWAQLRVLDPGSGMLGEMRRALGIVGQAVGEEVPFIQTIFNPLAQAKNLAGERLLADLRQHPDAFKAGLETITESTVRFIEAARETGIAGIFLALQHATYDLLSEAEYREFGRPYDLRILAAGEGFWFNLLHLHGHNVMFDLVADYPVQAINWHDQETPPALGEALERFPGAVVGGIHREATMLRGRPEQVRAAVQAAIEATGGRRLIVGTGCVTFTNTPVGNIRAAREAVEGR
ncbi:MAG: uroporphyrinogen decarboxylase [Chloroflexi bacterium]|nr:uroporphyrinogen decarboxylase [Chloroflexota bacterium]